MSEGVSEADRTGLFRQHEKVGRLLLTHLRDYYTALHVSFSVFEIIIYT